MNRFFQFNNFFELGQIFHDCTAYKLSIGCLDKALELGAYLPIDNRLVKVFELRGNSNIFLGNYCEAISDFSWAIKIDSRNSYLYFSRGFTYQQLEEYPKAINDLKIAQRLDPEFGLIKSILDYCEEKDF